MVLTAVAVSDPLEQLVRHFLIETGPRGVKIKGCQNEPYFGKLSFPSFMDTCFDCVSSKIWTFKISSNGASLGEICFYLLGNVKDFHCYLLSTGSLSALVYQHAITPISLPCTLKIPEKGWYSLAFKHMEAHCIHQRKKLEIESDNYEYNYEMLCCNFCT